MFNWKLNQGGTRTKDILWYKYYDPMLCEVVTKMDETLTRWEGATEIMSERGSLFGNTCYLREWLFLVTVTLACENNVI
jgi:hypothetical protein